MAEQINAYKQEIFNFLRTVTIKFEPFAYSMGQNYMNEHGLSSPDFEENPYYQNLVGNYANGDTRMQVTTIEDGSTVEYNRELLTNYPETAALYRVPNQEYFTLEENYPNNVGLIRTIAYPVASIKEAIAAPNLSLLAYDETLLEAQEREDLLTCLREFLAMVRKRWWIDAYVYEDQYPLVFWGLLWQHLPLLLLTRRFKNIKTPYVHSNHVWEYLQSQGLNDYRDVLTPKQSRWLYRNIDYIRANRGKNETLKILAENLLPDVAVSLLYKDMYQETETRYDKELSTNPVFRSYKLVDDTYVKEESFADLNDKLCNLGVEHRHDAEFINDQELLLARHKYNILNTKFLEFKKEPIDTRFERLMLNFFLDTLFYRLHEGKVRFECEISDPLTTTKYKLSIGDTILLWHYSLWMAQGIVPDKIPTKAVCWIPFKLVYPGDNNITENVYISGSKYEVKSILDLAWLKQTIPWSNQVYDSNVDFTQHVVNQFTALITIRDVALQSHRKEYHDVLMQYLHDARATNVYDLNLTDEPDFESWCSSASIAPLIAAYNDIEDPKDLALRYGKLAQLCYNAIFPTDKLDVKYLSSTNSNMEVIYRSIRDLFIKLGSYNVFYLETERDRNEYLTFYDPDISFPLDMTIDVMNSFSWTHENYALNVNYKITVEVDDVNYDSVVDNFVPDITWTGEIGHDANITDIKLVIKPTFTTMVDNELTHIKFNWSCDYFPAMADNISINSSNLLDVKEP